MESPSQFLLTIGGILLLGLFASMLASRTLLPRVTLLIILGILVGQNGLNMIPAVFSEHFEIIADMTLLMVGFLLGGKLTRHSLQASTGEVMWISVSAALITAIVVSLGLIWLGTPVEAAIILGCLASATDPAAVLDVVTETKGNGGFRKRLLSIVALDDVWALALFGIGMSIVTSLDTLNGSVSFLLSVGKEIGGAILLGTLLGLPAAYLTGRLKKGQPVLTEALGIVFICGGLALWLEVSFLIAAMVMGAVIVNLAKHHKYPFHAIEGIEWPFMVIFFVLAGASLDLTAVKMMGLAGIVYILCRIGGKYLGAYLGGQISHASGAVSNWSGIALLPQAGIAIGMALVASNQFPEYRQLLLTIAISSTVFFEIVGPVFTRLAMRKVV